MDETKPKEVKLPRIFGQIPLSDTLLIASLPIFVYSLICAYNWGYLDAFGLPRAFVTFELSDVFVGLAGLLGFAAFIFMILNLFTSFFPKDLPAPVSHRLWLMGNILVVFLVFFSLFPADTRTWLIILAAMIVTGLILFAAPLLRRKRGQTYIDCLWAVDSVPVSEPFPGSLISRLVDLLGADMTRVLVYLAFAVYIVYNVGRSTALSQKVYRVANTSPECVVLYMTREEFVCAPFDRAEKAIDPSFILIDTSGNPNISYRLENIGPLSYVGPSQSTSSVSTPKAPPSSSAYP